MLHRCVGILALAAVLGTTSGAWHAAHVALAHPVGERCGHDGAHTHHGHHGHGHGACPSDHAHPVDAPTSEAPAPSDDDAHDCDLCAMLLTFAASTLGADAGFVSSDPASDALRMVDAAAPGIDAPRSCAARAPPRA